MVITIVVIIIVTFIIIYEIHYTYKRLILTITVKCCSWYSDDSFNIIELQYQVSMSFMRVERERERLFSCWGGKKSSHQKMSSELFSPIFLSHSLSLFCFSYLLSLFLVITFIIMFSGCFFFCLDLSRKKVTIYSANHETVKIHSPNQLIL